MIFVNIECTNITLIGRDVLEGNNIRHIYGLSAFKRLGGFDSIPVKLAGGFATNFELDNLFRQSDAKKASDCCRAC